MKTIYTFTLDDGNYPSEDFQNKLRLFACILYDYISGFDDYGKGPLDINSKIVRNNMHEIQNDSYYLDSDVFDNGYINYEPFIIGERSFGLTIVDGLIDEATLISIVGEVQYLLKLRDYKIKIDSVNYFSTDIEDERMRRKAIITAYSRLGCDLPARNIFAKKKTLKLKRACIGL